MPKAGDKFKTNTYQNWGEYNPKRVSPSRPRRLNETYIVIPRYYAEMFGIYMKNKIGAVIEYDAYDQTGQFICTLKAQGNQYAGDIFAKQFAGRRNLTALVDWIDTYGVTDNDVIEVEFLTPNSLRLTVV